MPRIRGRDVEANVKEHGFERGMVLSLRVAIEEISEMRSHIHLMSGLIDQCIRELEKLIAIGGQMKQNVDQLHRDIKGNVDGETS